MASFTWFVSLSLLFLSIVGLATASPHTPLKRISVTRDPSRVNPASITLNDLAGIPHVKRARQPVDRWGEEHALPYGWSVTVSTMSMFMSFGSQAAANWFRGFFWQIQVASAARMLNNGPYDRRIVIDSGPWRLILSMHPQSTVQEIEWSFVYYFAQYMQNWVLNGYTGTGAIMFRHTSGVQMVAFFLNRGGIRGSILI